MTGTSRTKFCKGTNIPKHSGNYSPMRMHFSSRTYPMQLNNDGVMIIGEHTPASCYLPLAAISLLETDKFFKSYRREGVYKHAGKRYKCWMDVNKRIITAYGAPDYDFRMSIDTECEFEFNFPEL